MIWLTVREFAAKQNRHRLTIYRWVADGFVLELGFKLRRDVTGHITIGIPSDHPAFSDFRSRN